MSKDQPIKEDLDSVAIILKCGILIFLFFALIFTVIVISDLNSFSDLLHQDSIKYIVCAVIVQLVSYWLIVLAWHKNMHMHAIHTFSFNESISLVGLNAVGKYVPGKVMGAIVRGMLIYQKSTFQANSNLVWCSDTHHRVRCMIVHYSVVPLSLQSTFLKKTSRSSNSWLSPGSARFKDFIAR